MATIASNMGVALENARLFDETKHLLGQTEQRNAELAVINEIGEALARQLDFQGIIDAVGERIRAIFDVKTGVIALYDPATNTLATPYSIDLGERIHPADRPLGGLAEKVIRERRSLRLGSNARIRGVKCLRHRQRCGRVVARRAHPCGRPRARGLSPLSG